MSIRTVILFGALLATFAIAAVACSSSEPAEPAITEAQMRSIVADAVAQSQPAPQPQVSGDEIMAMVNAAMAAMPQPEMPEMPEMPEQVSAEEIRSMVQSAVEGAAMEGASPEEIKANGGKRRDGRHRRRGDGQRTYSPRSRWRSWNRSGRT